MTGVTRLSCKCGQVHIEVERPPIISAECHCNSCREAGRRLQVLPAEPFQEDNGGTRFVMFRKDRIRFIEGMEQLKDFRLTDKSTTRRVIAACCNTPVFLEFKGGHWLSLYSGLWPTGTLPPLDIRTMTDDIPEGIIISDDIPHGKWQTTKFYAKLLSAWIAMGFKSPKIPVNGEIHA